jgi:hypothetical protein
VTHPPPTPHYTILHDLAYKIIFERPVHDAGILITAFEIF